MFHMPAHSMVPPLSLPMALPVATPVGTTPVGMALPALRVIPMHMGQLSTATVAPVSTPKYGEDAAPLMAIAIPTQDAVPMVTPKSDPDERDEVVFSPERFAARTQESNEERQAFMTMIELRHGRKRITVTTRPLISGSRVLLLNSRGKEMGTVLGQAPRQYGEGAPKIRATEPVSEEAFLEFEKQCEQEEKAALQLGREMAEELQVPLTIHCATMQYERSRFVFHFSSEQEAPDFRRLVKVLRSKLDASVWFNNCAPKVGSTGELIRECFYSM